MGRAVDAMTFLLLFLMISGLQVLCAGIAGVLSAAGMGIISLAGLTALFASGKFRSRIISAAMEIFPPIFSLFRNGIRKHPFESVLVISAGCYFAVRSAMFIFFLPPTSFDSLTYHLSKVAQWIATGSIYLPDLPVKRVFWPSGMEILNAWWAVFLHNDYLVNVPGVFFYFLSAGSVWSIARQMPMRRSYATLCAVAFALTPCIVVHAPTCLTDLPVASVLLYITALWIRPLDSEDLSFRRWGITFTAVCLGIGIKPTLAFTLPGIVFLALFSVKKQDFTAFSRIRNIKITQAGIAAAALFSGSYWYVRNWIRFGNPLYPVVMGTVTEDGIQSGSFSLSSLSTALTMLVAEGGVLDGKPVVANLAGMTGWGWFAVSCGIAGSLYALFLSGRFRVLAFANLISMLTVLSMVNPDASCLRFILWMPSVFCVGFFVMMDSGRVPSAVKYAFAGLALWTSLLNAGSGLSNAVRIDWRHQVMNPRFRPGGNGVIHRNIDVKTAGEDVIAVCLYKEDPLYFAYGYDFRRLVVTIDETGRDSIADEMKAAGVRCLFSPRRNGCEGGMPIALDNDLRAGRIKSAGAGLFILTDEYMKGVVK